MTREQQKLLAHSLREAIMGLLRQKPMTAKQVATALGSSVGNAHYHLQRMLAADLLAVQEELTENGIVEKRYRLKEAALPALEEQNAFLTLDETLWLTVAETGQLVNELTAFLHHWHAEHREARARTRPFSLSIRGRHATTEPKNPQ